MIDKFDIAVVGAGPAGSRAAFAAAQAGVSVVMLERHHRVGEHILCAEGLSRSMVRGFLEIKPRWIAAHLNGAILKSPSRRQLKLNYPGVGYVLDRKVFDYELAKIAERAGACVITGAEVVGVAGRTLTYRRAQETKQLEFNVLVGADGAESRVGRLVGINTGLKLKEVHVCAQYRLGNLRVVPDCVEFYLDGNIAPGGYAWVFPKSETVANVGLGLSPLKTKVSPQVYLDRWIESEFPKATKLDRLVGVVPARMMKRYTAEHCLLTGDAARFCDPLSGGGIAAAIKSGYLAGINAARIVKGQRSTYESEVRAELEVEISLHDRVRDVYLKFDNRDFELVFDFFEDLYGSVEIRDINSREIIRKALSFDPRFLRLGSRLLPRFLKVF